MLIFVVVTHSSVMVISVQVPLNTLLLKTAVAPLVFTNQGHRLTSFSFRGQSFVTDVMLLLQR